MNGTDAWFCYTYTLKCATLVVFWARFKVLLFVTYSIIQNIISSEMYIYAICRLTKWEHKYKNNVSRTALSRIHTSNTNVLFKLVKWILLSMTLLKAKLKPTSHSKKAAGAWCELVWIRVLHYLEIFAGFKHTKSCILPAIHFHLNVGLMLGGFVRNPPVN